MHKPTFLLIFLFIIRKELACSIGQYDDNGCQPCHFSCKQCNGGSLSQCTKCSPGSFLTNTNRCQPTCATGYIQNTSTNKCDKCHSSCTTCINTTTTCVSCTTGRVFFSINSTCLTSCPIYYKNQSGLCTIIFCSTQCGNCSGIASNNCTDCFVGFDYHSDVMDCTPWNQYYHIGLETGYLTTFSNETATFGCGIYMNILGMFAAQQKVTLFALTDLQSHVAFRLMVWILWVDRWDNNDYIHFAKQDNTDYFAVNYSSASRRQSHVCGDPAYRQRLSIAEGNRSHNSSDITVIAFTDHSPYPSSGWGYKQILLLLMKCHRYCEICTSTSNSACSVCALYQGYKYLLSGTTCAYNCLETYYFHLPWNCTPCTEPCYSCKETGTYCLKCITGHVFFPPNNTCPEECPAEYYFNVTTNQCEPCYGLCYLCTGYPSPCQKCQPDVYFMKYNDTCWDPCPSSFYQFDMEWLCLLAEDYIVNVSIGFIAKSQSLLITMEFTHLMDFGKLEIQTFQTISFGNSAVTIDKFYVTYNIVNSTTYTIELVPIGIMFMRKVPVTVTTKLKNGTITSLEGLPLSNQCYNKTNIYPWTLMEAPQLNVQQSQVISTLSVGSSTFNKFWNLRILQDIKQLGLFLLLFNYLQIPAMIILLNIVYPASFYDGTRILASFVLIDIPEYQQESNKIRYIMNNQWYNVDPTKRLLQAVETPVFEWRFGRTGFLGNFILDCYGTMILLSIALILLLVSNLVLKYCKNPKKAKKLYALDSYLYSFLHRVNEVVLFSFTLSIYFQILYFTPTGLKIFSAFLCVIFNGYLLLYQMKMFYDLHRYGSKSKEQMQQLIHKYGSILRWIRYDTKVKGYCLNSFSNIRQLFQPYNYHVLSYYKKAMMLLSICLFYDFPLVQISILLLLQSLEIIRFLLTIPYTSKTRNFIQMSLEILLLIIFILILISLTMINTILSSTDLDLNFSLGASWVKLGWAMVSLLWFYCLVHFVIDVIGLFYKYKYTNQELYWRNAKKYYYRKIQQYEQHDIEAPTKLVTQFLDNAKINTLNKNLLIESNTLNSIQIQCEQISFSRRGLLSFQLKLKKALGLKMSKLHKLYSKKCSIKIEERINKTLIVTRKNNPFLFKLADSNFQTFEVEGKLNTIRIKTFVEIHQNNYAAEEHIKLTEDMKYSHQLILDEENQSVSKLVNLIQKLPNYPLQEQYVNEIMLTK